MGGGDILSGADPDRRFGGVIVEKRNTDKNLHSERGILFEFFFFLPYDR